MTDDGEGVTVALIPPLTPISEHALTMGGPLEDPASVTIDERPCWRRAAWYGDSAEWGYADPDTIEVVSLVDLSDEVGEAWTWWLEVQTESALGRLVGSMRPLGSQAIDEERARHLQQEVDALRRDVQWALPSRRWERFGPRRPSLVRRLAAALPSLWRRAAGDPATLLAPPASVSPSEGHLDLVLPKDLGRHEVERPSPDPALRNDERREPLHG